MIQQAIANLEFAFKKLCDDFEENVVKELPPVDPILEYDSHDIPAAKYDNLTCDRTTFVSPEGLSYTDWLPQSAKKDFAKSKAFPIDRNGNYQAKSISIMQQHGLVIEGIDRVLYVFPPLWEEVAIPALPDNFEAKGEEAFCLWQAHWQMVVSLRAKICVFAIRRNPNLLSHIREDMPYLLDHPDIQKELVEAFRHGRLTEPKSSGGRPCDLTQAKFELYHWVYWYRHQGLPLEAACLKAISTHQNLIPNDWQDTDATLKKQVARLDKYPRISLRKFFSKKGQK
jgi:hypothetical protein